jgi:hypothetical protein
MDVDEHFDRGRWHEHSAVCGSSGGAPHDGNEITGEVRYSESTASTALSHVGDLKNDNIAMVAVVAIVAIVHPISSQSWVRYMACHRCVTEILIRFHKACKIWKMSGSRPVLLR